MPSQVLLIMASKKPLAIADPSSRSLINRVLKENFHLYVGRYLIAFLLMTCAAAATGVSVFLMQNITAVVFGSREATQKLTAPISNTGSFAADWVQRIGTYFSSLFVSSPGLFQIFSVSIAIIIVFLIKGLSLYGSSVILTKIGNNIVSRQQQRIGNHVLNQSLAFFVHFPSSDLITRISHGANSAREVMNLLMTRVQDVLTALALLLAMFRLDWQLSCAALFIFLPMTVALSLIIKRIRNIARSQYRSYVQVIATMQEAIIGNKLIKSYNLENSMRQRFNGAIQGVEKLSNKMATVSARTSPIMEFIGGIAVAAIVFYGGYRNLVLGQSADSLIAFLAALLLAYEPVKRIARMNVTLHAALIGLKMLYNVLDSDYSIPDADDAKPLQYSKGEISLKNVTFSYRNNQPVLHDLSLTCAAGHVTALVGPSGSGKSTILNLIERFYAVDHGRIEIDGQEISGLKTESLRANMSLVSQDTFLFSDTLRNNIRFARPDATDEEIKAAAKAAFAHDFIMKQPKGYDTEIGENGGSLSGGQRQRISIARAFLKNAPILLLDEATSALDSESEKQIQCAFDTLMQGRTTIVIAHRFSTIRNAHKIHVMQNGRLVASGSHQELISDEKSLYAHLYHLQHENGIEV
jgi:subfamily B ATP-binding cassette protein MsbA